MADTFGTDQFSLRWNNFSNNLTSGFMSHLSDKDLVDVTLAVDGQLLQAHKLVLSVCSPYFKDIFKSNPCQHPVVILQDIGYAEVEALLRFMYQGEVNVRQEELATFLRVAEILRIKGLTGDDGDERRSVERDNDRLSSNQALLSTRYDSQCCTIDAEEQTHKRRSRESGKKQGIVGNSTKKPRFSLPALRDMDAPVAIPQDVDTATEVDCQQAETTSKPSHSEKNSNDSTNHDETCAFEDDTGDRKSQDVIRDEEKEEFVSENATRAKASPEDTSGTVTYRLSARGRPQLVHEGYVYNLTSRSEVLNRSHYRCAEQHRGCRGKCAVIAERFMPTGVYEHNHLPGYQSENDYRKKKAHDTEQN